MDNNINVCNQDYLDFLLSIADGEVDLVLIDPPYTISRQTGFSSVVTGVKRFAVSMDFGEWDHAIIDLDITCQQLYRKLRKGGTAIIFYDLWKITLLSEAMTKAGFKQIRLIIWQKTNPVPLNSRVNYLTNAREIAILGVKVSKPTFNSQYDNGVYQFPIPREQRFHPTQKPIKLIQALIEKHSNEGDLVLDCFMGAGTSAVAALRTGRKFVGCEIDTNYFEKAYKRIQKEII